MNDVAGDVVRHVIHRTFIMSTQSNQQSQTPRTDKGSPLQLNPGDDALPGTPGTGEDICEVCHGSGKTVSGGQCPNCGGTGKIVEGIGGG